MISSNEESSIKFTKQESGSDAMILKELKEEDAKLEQEIKK
jgi:hypothetical protein